MTAVNNTSSRKEASVSFRIVLGLISLSSTYLGLRWIKLDVLWAKMMVAEVTWFIGSLFILFTTAFLALVIIRKRMFPNLLVSAGLGAVMGFIVGAIALVIAGHVRGGILFRLTSLVTHPVDQAAVVFMTATWLIGIMAFLTLHLIWVLAIKVRMGKHSVP